MRNRHTAILEDAMNRRPLPIPRLPILAALSVFAAGAAVPASVVAQTAHDLAGTYQIVSVVNTAPDGTKRDIFGAHPAGIEILGSDGRFAITLARSDLPKFASGNRLTGTADEYKALAQGTIAYFGTWSVAGKVLTLHVEGGSWPGYTGTDQTREITAFDGHEMTVIVPSSASGGTSINVWRRVQ
jgi:Lipocalin-like domain